MILNTVLCGDYHEATHFIQCNPSMCVSDRTRIRLADACKILVGSIFPNHIHLAERLRRRKVERFAVEGLSLRRFLPHRFV
jgi:hypothetical protein